MARILAVTWDGGGNVPPLLGIITRLRERGHTVRVLGHDTQRAVVEATDAAFVAYRHARPWSSTAAVPAGRRARDLFALFTETGPARDVTTELVGPDAPDLLLVDGMRLSALRAAVRSPVPTVALLHSFRRYVAHDWARGPVGLLATLRGLRPGPLWDASDLVVVATDRDLDPAGDSAPANVRYTGAVHPEPRTTTTADPDGSPTVLVSLSTIYYPTQAAVLQRILDGLSGLDVDVVAASGPVDPAELRAGPRTELRRHLAHDEIMPTASLLIGHGGHATTLRALAHDLPVLVVPLDTHLDHRMIGEAVRAARAGDVLTGTATPAAIREAARALLADGQHRDAVATVGARIRATDGASTAADEIETLLPHAPRPGTTTDHNRSRG